MTEQRPRRIRLSRRKGWRLPPQAAVVARPTKWGNPFRAATAGEREQAVRRYRAFIEGEGGANLRRAARAELAGLDLACWCPLDGPCHADVLLEIANAPARSLASP